MATVNKIKVNNTEYGIGVEDLSAELSKLKQEGFFYVEGSGTTDATNKISAWTGTCDRFTSYYDGLSIRYKIGVVGQSTVTLNINNLGAKTVYRFNTTKLTTHFPVGSIIHLIYHSDLNNGCWIANDYDANTNTYQRLYESSNNVEYPITTRYNTTDGETYYAEYGRYTNGVTLNPSTNTITATAFNGNATSASKFQSAQTIALTGDVTGSESSTAGWSISTTLANSGVTAGSYGPSANASPTHSGTFSVPYITVDAKGRVTAASTKTITLPASGNTDTKVTQAAAITTDGAYPILLGYSTATTAVTNTVNKASTLTYNPSTKILATSGITASGQIKANGASAIATAQVRNIYAGTSAMTDGSTALTAGTIYLQY